MARTFASAWAACLLCGAVAHSVSAGLVLDDQFSSWYYSGTRVDGGGASNGNFEVAQDGSRLTWKTSVRSSYAAVTYASQSLGVGQALSATFTLSATGLATSNYGFRLAFLSSGGNPITSDNLGTGNDLYKGYSGYAVFADLANAQAVPLGAQFFSRKPDTTDASKNLMGGNYPIAIAGTDVNPGIAAGTPVTGQFTITNTGSGIKLEFVMGQTKLTTVETATNYTAFDTLLFQVSNSQAATITFTDVQVRTVTVPEPATAASLLGALAGSWCLLSRRGGSGGL